MGEIIKVEEIVYNYEGFAYGEVHDLVASLIEKFRKAGFSDDDIKEGIKLALEEEF